MEDDNIMARAILVLVGNGNEKHSHKAVLIAMCGVDLTLHKH